MSKNAPRGWQLVLVVVLATAGFAPAADEPDILKDAKRRKEVAAQQLEAAVREGLIDAARLQRGQPDKAAALLRDLLRQVDDDSNLTPERRIVLRQRLRGTIRRLDEDGNHQNNRRTEEAIRKAETNTRRVDDERRRADGYRLSRQMQIVAELRRAGRIEEANRLSAELAASNPGNPAVEASRRTTTMAERLADARVRRDERNERMLGVGREIEKSSMPPIDDVELPRDWREKSARRSSGSKMTEKEKAIMKALETPIQADLTGTFSQAIDYLQTVTGQTIIVDKQAMDEVNINSDTPVAIKLRKATTRSVLKKLLAEHNLAYVIQDQTIFVTSQARARENLTTRTYYIGDLAGQVDVRFGPALNRLQALQSIGLILDTIVGQIEPQSWQVNGGPGSITFEPLTMSLIVRQTAEIHLMMGGGR